MKLLTGNDLKSGAVTWWTGSGWSIHVEDAADVGEHGDGVLAAEDGARRVNAPYIIEAVETPQGPRPAPERVDRHERSTDCPAGRVR